jgi:type II secretory pathway component GspD/PulD (secretin)
MNKILKIFALLMLTGTSCFAADADPYLPPEQTFNIHAAPEIVIIPGLKIDVRKDIETKVKALLTPSGSLTVNPDAGTITVRDNPPVLRMVERYVAQLNDRLSRSVVLTCNVWRIERADAITDLNLSFLFDKPKIITGASPLPFGKGGELSTVVVDGKLNNSYQAILDNLHTLGKATHVTSGGGIVMNGQSLPLTDIKRVSYQNENSDNVSLAADVATIGFAMTVVPDIAQGRHMVLRYSVNQSGLNGMESVKIGDSITWTPKISELNFSRETALKKGQTLVLAGFVNANDKRDGLSHDEGNILIITLATEEVGRI